MRLVQEEGKGFARLISGLAIAASLLCSNGPAWSQEKSAACKPVESAAFVDRVHVRCEFPVDGKYAFFAAPTSEPKFANRVLSVILTAQQSGKVLTILFNPSVDPVDAAGQSFGCNPNDCRRISAIVLNDGTLPPGPPSPPPPRPPRPPSAAHVQCMTICDGRFDTCESAASTQADLAQCKSGRLGCAARCPP